MATMPASEIIERWRPGSYNPPWTWGDELNDIMSWGSKDFLALVESIKTEGIKEPVILGKDGRVWDGHHRILAAAALEVSVPYKYRSNN